MVGNNLKDTQLQQIVDKTILFADKDEDGKINFEEFCSVSSQFLSSVQLSAHVEGDLIFCINLYDYFLFFYRL